MDNLNYTNYNLVVVAHKQVAYFVLDNEIFVLCLDFVHKNEESMVVEINHFVEVDMNFLGKLTALLWKITALFWITAKML